MLVFNTLLITVAVANVGWAQTVIEGASNYNQTSLSLLSFCGEQDEFTGNLFNVGYLTINES
jgi:hypothetical protein